MSVVSIHVVEKGGGPVTAVPAVRAIPGQGLEGDRNCHPDHKKTGQEVTLIEIEAIEALEREMGVKIRPCDARRNIVTRGVALNHLVGREFKMGDVTLRGMRLCEPCAHLVKLIGEPKILPGLVHRGGLRADIVTEGTIRTGDECRMER